MIKYLVREWAQHGPILGHGPWAGAWAQAIGETKQTNKCGWNKMNPFGRMPDFV